jgi:hypothetical protein
VSAGLDVFIEHAFDFIHREIGDHRGPGIAGGLRIIPGARGGGAAPSATPRPADQRDQTSA